MSHKVRITLKNNKIAFNDHNAVMEIISIVDNIKDASAPISELVTPIDELTEEEAKQQLKNIKKIAGFYFRNYADQIENDLKKKFTES